MLDWWVAESRRKVVWATKEPKTKGFDNVRRLRHLSKGLKTKIPRMSRLKHPGSVLDIFKVYKGRKRNWIDIGKKVNENLYNEDKY